MMTRKQKQNREMIRRSFTDRTGGLGNHTSDVRRGISELELSSELLNEQTISSSSGLSGSGTIARKRKDRKSRNECLLCLKNPQRWYAFTLHHFRKFRAHVLVRIQNVNLFSYFWLFVLPCLIDITWVFIYFYEVQVDLLSLDGPCYANYVNGTVVQSPPSGVWETPRPFASWVVQVTFAVMTLLIWTPFRIIFAGSRKFRWQVYVVLFLDLCTCFLMFLSIFLPKLRTAYIPSFLRIWVFRFELGFVISDRTLKGEVWLFCAAALGVAVTMVAVFEWSQNNFPISTSLVDYLYTSIPASVEGDTYSCVDFVMCVYWLVVTVSTVGYGDVVPLNLISRVVTILSIAIFLLLLPYALTRVTSFIQRSRDISYRRFSGHAHNQHIVVNGYINESLITHTMYYFNPIRRSRQNFREFSLTESDVARDDNDSGDDSGNGDRSRRKNHADIYGDETKHVVLMSEHDVNDRLKAMVKSLGYHKSYVSMLQGTLLEHEDIDRCQVTRAACLIILPVFHVYHTNVYYHDNGVLSSAHEMGSAVQGIMNDNQDKVPQTSTFAAQISNRTLKVRRSAQASQSLYNRDYRNLVRAWAVHQTLHEDQFIIVVLFHEINKPYLFGNVFNDEEMENQHLQREKRHAAHRRHIKDRNIHALTLDRFQQEFFACSCIVPGFTTLVTNMFVGEDRQVLLDSKGSLIDAFRESNECTIDDDFDVTEPNQMDRSKSSDFRSTRALRTESIDVDASHFENLMACPCYFTNSPSHMLTHYARGVQNELEVLEVKENNPFVGWSRLELAATVYRDFKVLVLAVLHDFEVNALRGDEIEFDLFGNVNQDIILGDVIVFLGVGKNLDSLYEVQLGDYGNRKNRHNKNVMESYKKTNAEKSKYRAQRQQQPVPVSFQGIDMEAGKHQGLETMFDNGEKETEKKDEIHSMASAPPPDTSKTDFTRKTVMEPTAEEPEEASRSLEQGYVHKYSDLLANRPGSRGHIICCGDAHSPIVSFVKPFHRTGRPEWQVPTILWMVTEPPNELVWGEICSYPGVHWTLGDSNTCHDLERAGLAYASDFVFLSDSFDSYAPTAPNSSEIAVDTSVVDRNAISTHRIVTRVAACRNYHKLQIHTHLNAPANGVYLHESIWQRIIHDRKFEEGFEMDGDIESVPSGVGGRVDETREPENNGGVWFSHMFSKRASSNRPDTKKGSRMKSISAIGSLDGATRDAWPILLNESYASGEIWSASCFFFILFSTYVSGDFVILEGLIRSLLRGCGGFPSKTGKRASGLRLVRIPPQFHGHPYKRLFTHCIHRHNTVCLGLYRGYSHGNHQHYKPVVLTNPAPTLIVNPCDYVYIIGEMRRS